VPAAAVARLPWQPSRHL